MRACLHQCTCLGQRTSVWRLVSCRRNNLIDDAQGIRIHIFWVRLWPPCTNKSPPKRLSLVLFTSGCSDTSQRHYLVVAHRATGPSIAWSKFSDTNRPTGLASVARRFSFWTLHERNNDPGFDALATGCTQARMQNSASSKSESIRTIEGLFTDRAVVDSYAHDPGVAAVSWAAVMISRTVRHTLSAATPLWGTRQLRCHLGVTRWVVLGHDNWRSTLTDVDKCVTYS